MASHEAGRDLATVMAPVAHSTLIMPEAFAWFSDADSSSHRILCENCALVSSALTFLALKTTNLVFEIVASPLRYPLWHSTWAIGMMSKGWKLSCFKARLWVQLLHVWGKSLLHCSLHHSPVGLTDEFCPRPRRSDLPNKQGLGDLYTFKCSLVYHATLCRCCTASRTLTRTRDSPGP